MPRSKIPSKRELEALGENDCTGGRSRLSIYKESAKISNEKANNQIYNYKELKYFLESNLKCQKCGSTIVIDEDVYLISSLQIRCKCGMKTMLPNLRGRKTKHDIFKNIVTNFSSLLSIFYCGLSGGDMKIS